MVMSAHVYECSSQDVEALKKKLSYDPYLDTQLIPPVPHSGKKAEELTEEERKEIEARDQLVEENMKKLHADKFGDLIFARQEFEIIDGATVGIEGGKHYLYLKANEEFLAKADEFFKERFDAVKRVEPAQEELVIKKIEERNASADAGFGAIFG